MDRTQRTPESQTADAPVARKPDPGAGHRSDSAPSVQRSPEPGGGPAMSGGSWEADDGLMSAMGMGDSVQRKRVDESAPSSEAVQARASEGVAGGGGAVPFQAKMEDSFGTSFAGVDSHVGGAAAESCEAMGAQAYATGNSVAFKKEPDEALVAHELTHVLQQRAGVQSKGDGESPALEAEADAVGARVAAGGSVADIAAKYDGGAKAAAVQRKEAAEPAPAAGAEAAGQEEEEEESPVTAEPEPAAAATEGSDGGEGGGTKPTQDAKLPKAGKPAKRPGEKEPPA